MTRRRTPEELLEQVQAEEARGRRGRLKIFLGYASRAGKSSRMFDEGCRRAARGQDLVVAAVQSAGPPVPSLTMIPQLAGGAIDVGGVLARHPRVCLVDALAWNNPPGSVNPCRWQDVRDIVAAGINVIASINIQYVTEFTARVERITGKHVDATIPQAFLYGADEIVVVDSPPEQVHLAELREITLLLAADIVDQQLEGYLRQHGIAGSAGAQERILICLTPRSNARAMIESGRHIAERFHGELIAAHVRQSALTASAQITLNSNLEMARQAGADIEILEGEDAIEALLAFARERGVTQIFIGHGMRSRWLDRLTGSPVGRLIRGAEGVDIRVFPQ
jgi:two-component system sensor histidine kinase KdpD